jgi:hypothetical protein
MILLKGVFPPSTFDELNLKGWWYGAVEFQYPPHQRKGSYAEEGRSVNFMKVLKSGRVDEGMSNTSFQHTSYWTQGVTSDQ